MSNIYLPPHICLEPYDAQTDQVLERPINATSSLSRNGRHLQAVLAHAITSKCFSKSADEPLSVSIVGGSYGPEADTIAAALYHSGVMGARIHSTDPDAELINMAEAGTYVAHQHGNGMLGRLENAILLRRARKFGFTVSSAPSGKYISSEAVRKNQQVSFATQNLAEDPTLPFASDLITCHNALPHIVYQDPWEAVGVLEGMAANLRPGGVLSLALHDHLFDHPFEDYAKWHPQAARFLVEEAGFIAFDDLRVRGQSTVFQKMSAKA